MPRRAPDWSLFHAHPAQRKGVLESGNQMTEAERLSLEFEKHVIKVGGGVSFVELERIAGPNHKGHHAVTKDMPKGGFVVFWEGVSEDFVQAIILMLARKVVYVWPTQLLVYLVDGKVINRPTLTRLPSRALKEPKWVPMCFNLESKRKK